MLFVSFFAVLALTIVAGMYAKRSVKKVSDFTNASGMLSTGMVTGALVGGFVGGTSIVGTGELAFRYGFPALWFTLGGGLSIILLGLFAEKFRRQQVTTLPALIGSQYGDRARLGASIFLCMGMFIQVIAQILAALPLLTIFWQGDVVLMALVPMLLLLAYVWFGGFMGASVVGSIKTYLLLILLVGTGIWLFVTLPPDTYARWMEEGRFTLFNEEHGIGWAQGGAMFVGIFSTQAYLQPIFASRDTQAARNGSFAAGLVIMLIGLLGAWIGMFMHDADPQLTPREAIPQFFLQFMPPWVTGTALAVILLSVVMTGAALALSIGTILGQDVILRYTKRFASDTAAIQLSRVLIFAVIFCAYLIVCVQADSLILEWAFLSMTLRGVTIFFPVVLYLLGIVNVQPRWITWSVWGAPIIALIWALADMNTGIDPFWPGAVWSLGCFLLGVWAQKKSTRLVDR
ncbi:sodium:solute symporter family protein [Brevibacillus dissolubilis]|uniref:sodium:solute symporter family protein n=1 Tax=Brevibacillus dissolubilis TaxID=1844116 RepID=UPI001116D967|nr:sodium:solute symporter family protein [Brevibacillus dissolubilis]